MIRLFAALPLPPDIAAGLVRRQHGLGEARWSPQENLHITLRFAGDVAETTAEDLDSELSHVAGEPFDLTLEGVGAFGEGRDIHAIWAGVAESEALRRLAQSCESAARRAGLSADTRAYRPHVTLAYLRRPDPAAVGVWIQSNNLLKSPVFHVDQFGLYSSHASKGGSRYRLERIYRLRAGT